MRHSRAFGSLLALGLVAAPALADEVLLKGGGRISGRVVERTATRVSIETGPGRVTLPMSRVESIVEGRSAIETFVERAAGLAATDLRGWTDLARWAEERDLITQARQAWQRVLAIDPRNPEANAGLGRVALDGVWMNADEAYRAQGYVYHEGRWITPAEHDAALRQRMADEEANLREREADLRVREAEARVREAEARAAEAEAAASEASSGIPYPYVWGSGPVLVGNPYGNPYAPAYGPAYGPAYDPSYGPHKPGYRTDHPRRHRGHHQPGARPQPRPTPRSQGLAPRSTTTQGTTSASRPASTSSSSSTRRSSGR
jgi:hypothetical protein